MSKLHTKSITKQIIRIFGDFANKACARLEKMTHKQIHVLTQLINNGSQNRSLKLYLCEDIYTQVNQNQNVMKCVLKIDKIIVHNEDILEKL